MVLGAQENSSATSLTDLLTKALKISWSRPGLRGPA